METLVLKAFTIWQGRQVRRGTCAAQGGKSFAAGEHGVRWGHVARPGRLPGGQKRCRTEKRTQVRKALPWGERSRTQGRGAMVCRCPEMGEDVAPREAGKQLRREHTTAVARAVGEAARGRPGAGRRRHGERVRPSLWQTTGCAGRKGLEEGGTSRRETSSETGTHLAEGPVAEAAGQREMQRTGDLEGARHGG